MGLNTTGQFTFKCFHKDTPNDFVWTSTKLEDFDINGSDFTANEGGVQILYNSEKQQYTVRSNVNEESVVDLVFQKTVEGVKFGKDGTTLYGEDVENPWGSMRHIFWPRCSITGTIDLKSKEQKIEIDGLGMYVFALQGMKPHHAAASWNFLNYISPSHSVVMMEFTTPQSYGRTRVNVGIVTDTTKVLAGTIDNSVVFNDREIDEVGWSIPKNIEFDLDGFDQDDKPIKAIVKGSLTNLGERVDIMHEIPTFVKNLVSGIAGTRPYIYQFCNKMELDIEALGVSESGLAYNEITFISD
ncbi:unnamed protein product [Kuraishia capsulata CBS 1993]|uniref:Survival factor 1 n=1 Tax=Kuraishia capsulata CBS 1993 TaxID=1382522 RepID=W6MR89_9ASCO|nr:uncharacterized protein KUCA_T00005229001 [Kuraishia capsulata CBS 1993]CDK29241.1 unnamed protein product [Kuraishia capsulata CBS 1993]